MDCRTSTLFKVGAIPVNNWSYAAGSLGFCQQLVCFSSGRRRRHHKEGKASTPASEKKSGIDVPVTSWEPHSLSPAATPPGTIPVLVFFVADGLGEPCTAVRAQPQLAPARAHSHSGSNYPGHAPSQQQQKPGLYSPRLVRPAPRTQPARVLSALCTPFARYWDAQPPTTLPSIVQTPYAACWSPQSAHAERSRRCDPWYDARNHHRNSYESERSESCGIRGWDRMLAWLAYRASPTKNACTSGSRTSIDEGPQNYFAEIKQAAFSPSHIVLCPGAFIP
ncbi:hypothetical protein B0H19DRAFT_1257050 [Mycena capillaripes]|nr:hypothetical protein B0H19DRAFT_1257050 [Mycena capillaripes]